MGVLLAVAVIGIGLTVASEVWTTVARRHRLEQLEFVGQQFTQAIGSYYESTPGPIKKYPNSLQDLLEDRRNAFVRRHLRQVYVNPFSGVADWEPISASSGGLVGVRSRVLQADGQHTEMREFVYRPAS